MKAAEVDILMLPGLGGGHQNTWYNRWLPRLKTARRVEQPDFWVPDRDEWVANVVQSVQSAARPVVIIAHSAGTITAAHAAPQLPKDRVAGAFLVAPPDLEAIEGEYPQVRALMPVPADPLPFKSLAVVSRNDPYCTWEVGVRLTNSWGAQLVDAGNSGHLNADSGHGPWPEGSLRFAHFLISL